MYGGEERCIQGFGGEPEGWRLLGKPRHRWKSSIKMDLREVGWGQGLDRFGSEQGQVVGYREWCNGPSGSIKCGEFPD